MNLEGILERIPFTKQWKKRREFFRQTVMLELHERGICDRLITIKKYTDYDYATKCAKKLETTLENRKYLTGKMASALKAFVVEKDDISKHRQRLEIMFDEEILQTYDMYQRVFDKIFPAVFHVIYATSDAKLCKDICQVLRKYRKEEYWKFSEILENSDAEQLASIDTGELLSDKGFEEAKKNFGKVALQGYSIIRDNISDPLVREKISYQDMDNAGNAYNLIRKLHKERTLMHKMKIELGFFVQMKRAMAQGRNVEEKICLLKQYGKEVLEMMKDSASDLMVVYDA